MASEIAAAVNNGQPLEDAKAGLAKLDEQMKYELSSEDGKAVLKQISYASGARQYVFRKKD